jgi:hypothetical protein
VASPAELLEHLEESLGPLNESKSVAESALEARGLAAISVLAFGRDPTEPSAHVTFGLSRHFLEGDGGTVVQELVIPVADRDFALGALTAIGGHVLKTHRALMPGERHRLHGWSGISRVGGVIVVPDPASRPSLQQIRRSTSSGCSRLRTPRPPSQHSTDGKRSQRGSRPRASTFAICSDRRSPSDQGRTPIGRNGAR